MLVLPCWHPGKIPPPPPMLMPFSTPDLVPALILVHTTSEKQTKPNQPQVHYIANSGETWGEHEIDYVYLIQADVDLDPNPNEVRVIT